MKLKKANKKSIFSLKENDMPNHLFRGLNPSKYPAVAGKNPKLAEYLDSWLKRFPDSQPCNKRDFEDWGENASTLVGFDRAGIKETLLPSGNVLFVSSNLDSIAHNKKGPVGFIYHGFTNQDRMESINPPTTLIGQDQKTLDFISNATDSSTYMESVGRKIIPTGVDPEEIDDAVRSIVGDEGKIFLKTIKKDMSGEYDIKPGISPWKQICQQDESQIWNSLQYEGVNKFYLIQQAMEPVEEYRFHVIGDKVVTGSACWSPFIPLHHQEGSMGPFDERMAITPHCKPEELRKDKHMTAEYLDFAKHLAKCFTEETKHLMAYTIDVCRDQKNDMIKLIEINPQLNAGRYASDANIWVKTISSTLENIEKQEMQKQMVMQSQQQLTR